jgi:hypothetical protein
MSDKKEQKSYRAQTHITTLSIGPESKELQVLPACLLRPSLSCSRIPQASFNGFLDFGVNISVVEVGAPLISPARRHHYH